MKLTAPDKIRAIRQRKGLSQEDVAAKMGIMQGTYNKTLTFRSFHVVIMQLFKIGS